MAKKRKKRANLYEKRHSLDVAVKGHSKNIRKRGGKILSRKKTHRGIILTYSF